MQAVHKPGPLKQQNKTHKHGKHRSNRSLENINRVDVKEFTKRTKRDLKKMERRNQARQIRKRKREEAVAKKRSLGSSSAPPFLVSIVSLHSSCDPWALLEAIKKCDEGAVVVTSPNGNCHISLPRYKQRFTFVIPQPGNIYAQLDAAKVSETLLLLHSAVSQDKGAGLVLTTLLAHGMPSAVHVLQGLNEIPAKKRTEVKKQILKDLGQKLQVSKLYTLEQPQEALMLLHHIGSQKQQPVTVRDRRPHLLAETFAFQEQEPPTKEFVSLQVSGYVRGRPLNVDGLVHLPGRGTFQLSQIDAPSDPYPLRIGKRAQQEATESAMEEEVRVLSRKDSTKQESLDSECVPDEMLEEQTWPSKEEVEQAEAAMKESGKRVPKGTSQYQAAWIVDSEGSSESDDSEEDSYPEDLPAAITMEESPQEDNDDISETSDKEFETMSTTEGDTAFYDEMFNKDDEETMHVRFQEERMNEMFPDEIDTPKDGPARLRFARYRGLKSFHGSPWDPNENLPSEYARIFQFENLQRTKKKVLAEDPEGALPGWYITLHIDNVPRNIAEDLSSSISKHPLVVYGQLCHEQKMSVVNCIIKRHSSCLQPIKSKQRLVFHIGYRRFAVQPIFSAHTSADKHKYEKFLKADEVVVATFFAPLVFPPAPVLVFKENAQGDGQTLVATGSVLSVDPSRRIIKRVILSGHPFKINRKSAVIRYMFFDRDDILWFKPVELWTKYGRRGHIREPLGTHGHMKCVFDGQLKSQDTVLMNLYKRVFPKWSYDATVTIPPTIFL